MRALCLSLALVVVGCTGKDDVEDTDTVPVDTDTEADTDTDTDTDSDTDTDTDSDTDTDTDTDVEEVEWGSGPGIWFLEGLAAVDVSPDGKTVLAQDMMSIAGQLKLVDVATGTVTDGPTLTDVTKNSAHALSSQGHIAAYTGMPVEASVWTVADGWVAIPSAYETGCDMDQGGAFDLVENGSVVVGMMWDGCAPLAFKWTSWSGTQILETMGTPIGSASHATNRASVVSGNGMVTGGFASYGMLDRSPVIWDNDGKGELLAPDETDAPGEVMAIDYEGTTLTVQQGGDGFVWSRAGGFVNLGRPETAMPTDTVYPNVITGDASIVYGHAGSPWFGLPAAFVWTAASGSRNFQPLLAAGGVNVPTDAYLAQIFAASSDGSVIAGGGYTPEGKDAMYIVVVDPTAAFKSE